MRCGHVVTEFPSPSVHFPLSALFFMSPRVQMSECTQVEMLPDTRKRLNRVLRRRLLHFFTTRRGFVKFVKHVQPILDTPKKYRLCIDRFTSTIKRGQLPQIEITNDMSRDDVQALFWRYIQHQDDSNRSKRREELRMTIVRHERRMRNANSDLDLCKDCGTFSVVTLKGRPAASNGGKHEVLKHVCFNLCQMQLRTR